MPRKNIYVRDEDMTILERAERLGADSMSSVIAEALRRYVEQKEAEAAGYHEHTLLVGTWHPCGAEDTRRVRLIGRKLAGGKRYRGRTSDRRDRWTDYEVYQTRSGKVVVWWRHGTAWTDEASTADYAVLDDMPGTGDVITGRALGQTLGPLPGDILQQALESLGREHTEYIE